LEGKAEIMSGEESWGRWLSGLASSAYDYVTSATGYSEEGEGGGEPEEADRRALWHTLKDHVGSDVLSLFSVPASLMEPISTLQKMAEIMEHSHLLDSASSQSDPTRRVALVSAFALSVYAASERTYKPFNPILGETFECSLRNGSVSYIAEQVSHHPPVASANASGPGWSYEITSAPTTRFLGNSIEVHPLGRTRIHLAGKTYSLAPPANRVHNVILGFTWIDTYGQMEVKSLDGSERAILDFYPCGWFGANQHVVSGFAESTVSFGTEADDPPPAASAPPSRPGRRSDKRYAVLYGKWNSYLTLAQADADLSPVEGTEETLWQAGEFDDSDPYGFTKFVLSLNSSSTAPPEGVLPSDSRLRPDRAALASGDTSAAGKLKHELEEAQRAERRERESRGNVYSPRYFVQVEELEETASSSQNESSPAADDDGEEDSSPEPTAASESGIIPWQMIEDAFLKSKHSKSRVEVGASPHTANFNPWQYPELHSSHAYAQPGAPEDEDEAESFRSG
jgi:hypothetical protein